MSAVCPVCTAPQNEGLLCVTCTDRLSYKLADIPALVDELDCTISKQTRMELSGKSGLAHERNAMHGDASLAADYLQNTITTWARDVVGEWDPLDAVIYRNRDTLLTGPYCTHCGHDTCGILRVTEPLVRPPTVIAAHSLLSDMPKIRRHPAVDELLDQIESAVQQAWVAVDRAANRTRFPVGPCPERNEDGDYCPGHVVAFIPTEDARPPRMECRTNPDHRWTSVQWMRTGKRILDRAAQIRRQVRGAA